jgi:HEPN domain-containing protein
MNRSRELAALLLEKARGDRAALTRLLPHAEVPVWTLGFHAQQAVEKSIKAVLAANSVLYPPSHDIERLLQLLTDAKLPLPPDSDKLPGLTPFAAALRYEDDLGVEQNVPLDRDWALRCASATIAWAESVAGLFAQSSGK